MYACKPSVEGALKGVPGVHRYKVEIPPKDHAWVIFDPNRTNVEELKAAIASAGYDVGNVIEDYRVD